jgi:hypothetical protein
MKTTLLIAVCVGSPGLLFAWSAWNDRRQAAEDDAWLEREKIKHHERMKVNEENARKMKREWPLKAYIVLDADGKYVHTEWAMDNDAIAYDMTKEVAPMPHEAKR